MSAKKWYSGPPPSIGWWPASHSRNDGFLRWWNGVYWSVPVHLSASAELAGFVATMEATNRVSKIPWQRRPKSWPSRSRT